MRSVRSGAPRRAILVLVLLPFVVATGCRGDGAGNDLGLSAELSFAPTPPVIGPNPVLLTVRDAAGAPVTHATVRLEGTMTHAGMVPVWADAEPLGEGRYRIAGFEFTMGGDWILFVHVTLPDGTTGRIERVVRVLSAPTSNADRPS
jgi:hypothetical protein